MNHHIARLSIFTYFVKNPQFSVTESTCAIGTRLLWKMRVTGGDINPSIEEIDK